MKSKPRNKQKQNKTSKNKPKTKKQEKLINSPEYSYKTNHKHKPKKKKKTSNKKRTKDHPPGQLHAYVPHARFLHIFMPGSVGLGRFSRCRLRGTQGARVYTTAQVWGPAGLRGARSGRSKSRDPASNQGIAFRLAESRRTLETPQRNVFVLLLYPARITPPPKLSSSLLGGSQGTTAVAHQALPFVKAKDGASV